MRAIFHNGLIYPSGTIPPELAEGQEVNVEWEFEEPSDDPADIEAWDREWRRVGPLQYEPGERERVEAVMQEADRQAKAAVRREMENGA